MSVGVGADGAALGRRVSKRALSEFSVRKRKSIDPRKFPNEDFELFSIPAYDAGKPERLLGSEIGSSKIVVEPGDVLISRIVPHIQRVWVVPENVGKRQIASGEWIIFRGDAVVPEFLRHMLFAKPFHEKFMQTVAGMGGSLLRARPREVERIEISVPESLDEQARIALILDKADAIQSKSKGALALTDDLLKASFVELFGDPKSNPFEMITQHLGKQASVKVGYAFQSSQYCGAGIRLCRGANVLPGRLDWSDVKYWTHQESHQFEEFSLQEGDVILALDRPWISSGLKVSQVKEHDLPALLVQRVARIRGRNRAHSDFIYQALRHPSFWSYCKPTETTIPHISPVELRDYPLIDPDDALLERFGEIARSVSTLVARQETAILSASECFAALSQRAFRGEL